MKNIVMTFLLPLISISCNGDEIIDSETGVQQESSIFGSWQLVERHHVLPSSVQIIENGEVIIFNTDGDFFGNSYPC
ncbi:MAG: hypothetical protein GDA42_11260 [Ekhidna sp.]|nr:hypothetical protein [Ekhidna sp.]